MSNAAQSASEGSQAGGRVYHAARIIMFTVVTLCAAALAGIRAAWRAGIQAAQDHTRAAIDAAAAVRVAQVATTSARAAARA